MYLNEHYYMAYIKNEHNLEVYLGDADLDEDIDFETLPQKNKDRLFDAYNIILDFVSLTPCLYHKEGGVSVGIGGKVETFEISISCCCFYRETMLQELMKAIGVQCFVSAYPYPDNENVSREKLENDIAQYTPDLMSRIQNFPYKTDRRYKLLHPYPKVGD